jgi:hypothetical protein
MYQPSRPSTSLYHSGHPRQTEPVKRHTQIRMTCSQVIHIHNQALLHGIGLLGSCGGFESCPRSQRHSTVPVRISTGMAVALAVQPRGHDVSSYTQDDRDLPLRCLQSCGTLLVTRGGSSRILRESGRAVTCAPDLLG